ncbi:MAG TPA: ribosome small subunit-dependent GTPase A [Chitinophagales bacterium]|nr:ribosome small subunit-dependent GTPase A [Chitinophagales bacterium]
MADSSYSSLRGRVLRSTGSWYLVRLDDGRRVDCRVKGKFRLEGEKITNPVAVGDKVVVELEESVQTAVIAEILPRTNYISRQSPRQKQARHIIAANIDQAFLIATVAMPRTSTGFIDRFLLTAEAYGIPAHIIFNKQDILGEKELAKQDEVVKIYRHISYPVHLISALSAPDVETIKSLMDGRTTLLAGHSGVGKSTLINAIHPQANLRTGHISDFSLKGKHVTTFAEMLELPFGGYVVDTPGIKEFGLLDIEPEEVSHYFREMRDLLSCCKFNNCLHINEPKCAVRQAVQEGKIPEERYKNYLNILEDCQTSKKQQYE